MNEIDQLTFLGIFCRFIFMLFVTVVDVSSSGWAPFKDEGSTEPDHSSATVHNQSGKFSNEIRLIF